MRALHLSSDIDQAPGNGVKTVARFDSSPLLHQKFYPIFETAVKPPVTTAKRIAFMFVWLSSGRVQ
jgi:hypothetical protein